MSNDQTNEMMNVQSAADMNFDEMDIVRGETPPDIKERCLKMCQDYLSGVWSEQTIDTIEVRRISGGFCNQMYYCGLIERSGEVPQEVVVRFYGPKYYDPCGNGKYERLSD